MGSQWHVGPMSHTLLTFYITCRNIVPWLWLFLVEKLCSLIFTSGGGLNWISSCVLNPGVEFPQKEKKKKNPGVEFYFGDASSQIACAWERIESTDLRSTYISRIEYKTDDDAPSALVSHRPWWVVTPYSGENAPSVVRMFLNPFCYIKLFSFN